MALYAEITLRAINGKTQVDINVDEILGANALYSELWRRRVLIDVTADRGPGLAESWLSIVLSRVAELVGTEVLVVQADEAAAAPAETTLDLGELEIDEP